jgi:hypothetical protein
MSEWKWNTCLINIYILHYVLHYKLRYLICCALCVSRITFTLYIHNQKIRKPNKVNVLLSNKTKGPKQDSPKRPKDTLCLRENNKTKGPKQDSPKRPKVT